MAKEPGESREEEFSANETVNGIEISVNLASSNMQQERLYEIYFPQIEVTDEQREKGIGDQVIIISKDPETARRVFEAAKIVAEQIGDAEKVYSVVENFCRAIDEKENENKR